MRTLTRTAGAIATPVARWTRATCRTSTLTLLGWHRIGDAADGLTTSFDDFRGQLDVLTDWDAVVLPLDEAVELLAADRLPPRAVALTFDDGYASVLELAWPELQERGLPATLFAVSDFLHGDRLFPWDERHGTTELTRLATAAQVRDAADDGLDIGSHTRTHRWLPSLTAAEVAEELRSSRTALEDLLQRPIRTCAYPMGGYHRAIRDLTGEAGYAAAITCDRGRNRPHQDRLALRRSFAFDDPADVRRQLDGGYTWMRAIEDRRYRREPQW
ncbi:polysaccharide deacetylase family protein [Nocardioides massiliensis]|uniref:Peptidoglycan/xylan/chitin deacetylase (PgdA/CDA1 family) n=1 Tax=Nocardioides massiliensis TaxID=1325935 RepID=A0ABT9NMA2_9ACTN|nr:polysaccharide deacetylase family protein [Nocardioides massiliensis]MDP9821545.1 peptidoglycan/xylan/chitin deacetylase (PgdA/CDA1 family) [Nocardioides massiliensis]